MRKIIETSRFCRDLKRSKKRGKNIKKLKRIVDILQQEGNLPSQYKPHKLVGNWHPKWECHIEADWLLIYEVDEVSVFLVATGSHSDLFKK